MSKANENLKLLVLQFVGIGTVVAVAVSWSANKSVGWALLHGMAHWFYVLYWLFFGTGGG